MPLSENEISEGIVAYFDADMLTKSDQIDYCEKDVNFRSGPFLCIMSEGDESAWLQITGTKDAKNIRLEILKEWRCSGSDHWRTGPQYIHDARKPFRGKNTAFVAAAAKDNKTKSDRPYITRAGIIRVVSEVEKYKK